MHIGASNPGYSYSMQGHVLEETAEEKDLGLTMDDQLPTVPQSDLLSCDKSPQNTRNDQAGICKPGRSHPTSVVQDDGEANPRIWQLCLGTSHVWRPRQTRESSETGNKAGSGDTASTISGTPAAPKSPQSTILKRMRRYDYCLPTHDWQDSTQSINLLHQSPIRLKYTRTQPEATDAYQ